MKELPGVEVTVHYSCLVEFRRSFLKVPPCSCGDLRLEASTKFKLRRGGMSFDDHVP